MRIHVCIHVRVATVYHYLCVSVCMFHSAYFSACLYMCVILCVCVSAYVYMRVCNCISVCVYACARICMNLSSCIFMRVFLSFLCATLSVCIRVYFFCVCVYTCVYVCMRLCYVCAYMAVQHILIGSEGRHTPKENIRLSFLFI